MGESIYHGSFFMYQEKGMEFKIGFKCTTKLDLETGIELSKVDNIKVFIVPGMADGSGLVDMEKLETFCENKAINTMVSHKPPLEL